jgi:hypothetical protein
MEFSSFLFRDRRFTMLQQRLVVAYTEKYGSKLADNLISVQSMFHPLSFLASPACCAIPSLLLLIYFNSVKRTVTAVSYA